MRRFLFFPVLLVLVLGASSCKKKPRPQLPPAVPQIPVEQPAPEPGAPPEEPVEERTEPEPAPLEPVEMAPAPVPDPVVEPEPEEPAPAPVAEPESPAPPPKPAPQLAPLLSPEQQSRYSMEIDAGLARARRNVAVLSRRRLADSDKAALNRIRTFIHQAESLRASDLAAAHGLARRADVLSAELVDSTR